MKCQKCGGKVKKFDKVLFIDRCIVCGHEQYSKITKMERGYRVTDWADFDCDKCMKPKRVIYNRNGKKYPESKKVYECPHDHGSQVICRNGFACNLFCVQILDLLKI